MGLLPQRILVAAVITSLVCFGLVTHAQVQRIGSWVYSPSQDAMTNVDTSMIYAQAYDYPRGASGSALVIRCQRGAPYNVRLFFAADRYIGLAQRVPVTYRIGSAPPVEVVWDAASNNRAVFIPTDNQASFLRALRDNPQLVLRISASTESLTYRVDTTALGGALLRLPCYTGP